MLVNANAYRELLSSHSRASIIDLLSAKKEEKKRFLRECTIEQKRLVGVRYCILNAEHAAWVKFKHTAIELSAHGAVSLRCTHPYRLDNFRSMLIHTSSSTASMACVTR